MGGKCNIHDLAFAARHSVVHFQSMVITASAPWDGVYSDAFSSACHEILEITRDPHLKNLFNLSLIADFLMAPAVPVWLRDFLNRTAHPASLLDLDIDILENGDWIKIPIIVAGEHAAEIRWFMVGLLNGLDGPLHIPVWASKIMDQRFRDQAGETEKLVRRLGPDTTGRGFVLFPLSPANELVQFKGSSASLSFGIAFKSLLTRHPVLPDLICTGALDASGDILPVGMMEQKIQAAFSGRFKCLICPEAAPFIPGNDGKGLIPVKTLSQAWTMASLWSGQQDNLLFFFSRALTDAGGFIDKMDSLPAAWIAGEKNAITVLMGAVTESPFLADRFTRKFEQMVDAFQLERAIAISGLASPSWTDTLTASFPMAALRYCLANLSLCNHRGQVEDASAWRQRGEALIDRVIKLDVRLVADFLNHSLVGDHNRFRFSLELPASLARVIDLLEKQYQVKIEFGCTTDTTLGRLYGTMVQNYGFCGPDHIQQVETFSGKARRALGENLSIEFKAQWMRQYDYLTSARIDAGDIEGAKAGLSWYLEIDALNEIPERLDSFSCWQFSAICRFLARIKDHGVERRDLYPVMESHALERFQSCHPWQLIFFNLGRIALQEGKKEAAGKHFERSMEICLSPHSGPTLKIMALKSLSFLAQMNQLPQNPEEIKPEIIEAAGQLNPAHFSFLENLDFIDALEYARKNHDVIFPFSYQ